MGISNAYAQAINDFQTDFEIDNKKTYKDSNIDIQSLFKLVDTKSFEYVNNVAESISDENNKYMV